MAIFQLNLRYPIIPIAPLLLISSHPYSEHLYGAGAHLTVSPVACPFNLTSCLIASVALLACLNYIYIILCQLPVMKLFIIWSSLPYLLLLSNCMYSVINTVLL